MAKNEPRPTVPSPSRPELKPRRALYPDARSASHRRYRAAPRLSGGLMKAALALSLMAASGARADAAQSGRIKEVGVGIVAGYPVGGTVKLGLDGGLALDAGAGFAGDAVFWGDVLYQRWDLLPQPKEGKLALYVGAGPRLLASSDAQFGLRTLVGVAWRLTKQPLEFFAEAGPVFRLTQGGAVDADGGVGVRVYLGR